MAPTSSPTLTPRRPLRASQAICSANRAGDTASWFGSSATSATAWYMKIIGASRRVTRDGTPYWCWRLWCWGLWCWGWCGGGGGWGWGGWGGGGWGGGGWGGGGWWWGGLWCWAARCPGPAVTR